jgi:hypothetical protein
MTAARAWFVIRFAIGALGRILLLHLFLLGVAGVLEVLSPGLVESAPDELSFLSVDGLCDGPPRGRGCGHPFGPVSTFVFLLGGPWLVVVRSLSVVLGRRCRLVIIATRLDLGLKGDDLC